MNGETKVTYPAEESSLSVILDTNAIRALGELEDVEWSKLRASWRSRGLTTAWVPWNIAEVVGSNLSRKAGLTDAALADVVRAVHRFDELASGPVLPDQDEIIRRSLYSLAGVAVPPIPRANGNGVPTWREVIDVAKDVESAGLVHVEKEPGRLHVVLKRKRNPNTGIEILLDLGFENMAQERLAFWRKRTKCARGAPLSDRVDEIVHFIRDFARAAALAPNIQVPPDVAERAVKAGPQLLDSPFGYRLVVESWYFHLRATGDKSSIDNNDMADIAIASYMPFAGQFVTDDENFQKLLRAVLKPGSNQVLSFKDFLRAVCESGPAPGV